MDHCDRWETDYTFRGKILQDLQQTTTNIFRANILPSTTSELLFPLQIPVNGQIPPPFISILL